MLWNVQDALTCLVEAIMVSTRSGSTPAFPFGNWNVRSHQPLVPGLKS